MNLMLKILRKIELDKLLVLKDKNFIKVVTGVRRAGKSTLLRSLVRRAKNKQVRRINGAYTAICADYILSCGE